jgi:uncharacterized protein YcbK (DUF882 family)
LLDGERLIAGGGEVCDKFEGLIHCSQRVRVELKNPNILPDLAGHYHCPDSSFLTIAPVAAIESRRRREFYKGPPLMYYADIDSPETSSTFPMMSMKNSEYPRPYWLQKSTTVICCAAVAALLLISTFRSSHAAAPGIAPFFLMGSGTLHLKNLRNKKEALVNLLKKDGSLDDAAFTEVDRVFGFPTKEKEEHISPRLLFMLSYFADQVAQGKTINIESAYRSPDYNDKIRKKGANAARTSTHMDGMALDFWIAGVGGKSLWQRVREKNCCGVGHYGGKSIHLDAGRPRFWEAATSGTKSKEPDYNRHIYLATDVDRYTADAKARLSLSGISTFGFGVKKTAGFFGPADSEKPVATASIATEEKNDCIRIADHKASRFLYLTIPAGLKAGMYKVRLDFCERPFQQMPAEISSNEIEVIR